MLVASSASGSITRVDSSRAGGDEGDMAASSMRPGRRGIKRLVGDLNKCISPFVLLCLINRIAHEYLLSSLVLLWLECIWTESLTKFQCLRVLRLACNCCGIGLIFEARALPMVEELQL